MAQDAATLARLCRQARLVVAMDADLTARTVRVMQDMLPGERAVVSTNTVKPGSHRIMCHKNLASIKGRLTAELACGKNVYIALGRKQTGIDLIKFFLEQGLVAKEDEIRFYFAGSDALAEDTAGSGKSGKGCGGITGSIDRLRPRVLMATTCIENGVSIEIREHFDSVFVIADNPSVAIRCMIQLEHRVRYPTSNSVHVLLRQSNLLLRRSAVFTAIPTSIKGLHDQHEDSLLGIQLAMVDSIDRVSTKEDDWLLTAKFYSKLEASTEALSRDAAFLRICSHNGWSVEHVDEAHLSATKCPTLSSETPPELALSNSKGPQRLRLIVEQNRLVVEDIGWLQEKIAEIAGDKARTETAQLEYSYLDCRARYTLPEEMYTEKLVLWLMRNKEKIERTAESRIYSAMSAGAQSEWRQVASQEEQEAHPDGVLASLQRPFLRSIQVPCFHRLAVALGLRSAVDDVGVVCPSRLRNSWAILRPLVYAASLTIPLKPEAGVMARTAASPDPASATISRFLDCLFKEFVGYSLKSPKGKRKLQLIPSKLPGKCIDKTESTSEIVINIGTAAQHLKLSQHGWNNLVDVSTAAAENAPKRPRIDNFLEGFADPTVPATTSVMVSRTWQPVAKITENTKQTNN